jgi:serine/threonine-protein kinase
MSPAVAAAKGGRYSPEFLAAIDWALAPHEGDRPKSVSEWSGALLGGQPAPTKAKPVTVAPRAAQPVAPPAPQPQDFDGGFLRELEQELAQHVGPIAPVMVRKAASKAQDSSELVRLLSADITHQGLRLNFERRFAELSRPVSQPRTTQDLSGPSQPNSARFSPKTLANAEAQLARLLGPIAQMIVKLAAAKARDESELYLLVADEIENPAEKKAFIRRALTTTGKP